MIQSAWWWSWLLMIVGVTGLYFSGKKKWWGWLIGIFTEILWVVYSVITQQYGFIVASIAYIAIYIKNTHSWKNK